MNTSSLIAIYMPLLIIFLIIIPQQQRHRAVITRIKKRRGVLVMTNEMLKKYVGKQCKISTGSFGTTVIGQIIDVNENWIEVETKKGNEIVNAEFVQSIKIEK